MNYKHFIELVTLSAIWGASFMFMRIASPELGPVTLIAFRAGIGFLTLLPFLLFYKQQQHIIPIDINR